MLEKVLAMVKKLAEGLQPEPYWTHRVTWTAGSQLCGGKQNACPGTWHWLPSPSTSSMLGAEPRMRQVQPCSLLCLTEPGRAHTAPAPHPAQAASLLCKPEGQELAG